MREPFKICSKIQVFFKLSCCFFWIGGGEFGQKRCKRGVLICQGQTGKLPCLNPEKMRIFPQLFLLFYFIPPKNMALSPIYELLF